MYPIAILNNFSQKAIDGLGNYKIGLLEEAQGLLVRSAEVDLNKLPNLLGVARAGAGVDNIPVEEATGKAIAVFNTPGANANAVAELFFIMLGLRLRNILDALFYIRSLAVSSYETEKVEALKERIEAEKKRFAGEEIAGKTLGVISVSGRVGLQTANLGINHGMKVIGYDIKEPSYKLNSEVVLVDSIDEVLRQVDVVTIHTKLLPATKGFINAEKVWKVKKGAILANFARVELCDNKAVLNAVNEEHLDSYLVDFLACPGILHSPWVHGLITSGRLLPLPHIGGSTKEAIENCARRAVQTLKLYLETGQVRDSVNFPTITFPREVGKFRLVVTNKNMPDMLGTINHILGKHRINISGSINKSPDQIGHNLIDVDTPIDPLVMSEIHELPGVIRVRVLEPI